MNDDSGYTQIKRIIYYQNYFPIEEIRNFTFLKSINYEPNEFKNIIEQIREKGVSAINELNLPPVKSFDDITFFEVTNQLENKYIVAIYDNDELWHDPQLMDIFPSK